MPDPIRSRPNDAVSLVEYLTHEEREVIELFRRASVLQQESILSLLRLFMVAPCLPPCAALTPSSPTALHLVGPHPARESARAPRIRTA